MPTADRHTASP